VLTTKLPQELPKWLKTAHQQNDVMKIQALLNQHSLVDIEDHTFKDILNHESVVLDLGGWRGNFAAQINAKYGCEVHVFEPNQKQIVILNDRFADNEKIHVHPYAVGGVDEYVKFYPSPEDYPGQEKGSSLLSASPYVDDAFAYDVTKLSLASAAKKMGIDSFDLIKMDIEGGEFELFDDVDSVNFLKSAKMLTVEFHFKMPVNDQILISEEDINRMIGDLCQGGFEYLDFGRNFQYIDCLFYKI
jgi:FkbM family methyltransferase